MFTWARLSVHRLARAVEARMSERSRGLHESLLRIAWIQAMPAGRSPINECRERWRGGDGVEPIVEVDRIDGKPRSVRELFVGRRYSVDYYQREYGWSEANVRELVEDLSGRFLGSWDPSHERSEVAGYRPYFLGPLVRRSRGKAGDRFHQTLAARQVRRDHP